MRFIGLILVILACIIFPPLGALLLLLVGLSLI